MAMNGNQLADEIKAAYDAIIPEGASVDIVFIRVLANAIVDHIQNNAKATGTDVPSGDTHNLDIN